MTRFAFTRIVLWILIGILLVVIFSGCGQTAPAPESVTPIGPSAKLYTVEHDGHAFVVFSNNKVIAGAGGIVHHPSCVCLRVRE